MLLSRQVFLLAGQQLVAEQHFLYLVKAQPLDGVGKPLAGDSLFPEQEDSLFHHIQHLFLAGEDLVQRLALGHPLAPAAAQVDPVTVGILGDGVEGTLVPVLDQGEGPAQVQTLRLAGPQPPGIQIGPDQPA